MSDAEIALPEMGLTTSKSDIKVNMKNDPKNATFSGAFPDAKNHAIGPPG
jgi:hypothetical protein